MHTFKLIQKTRELREKGLTYSEINQQLRIKIPKNTLSYWCRGVQLPIWYPEKIKKTNLINLKKARAIGLPINKKKRQEYLDSLLNKNINLLKNMNKNVQRLLLTTLYLGEGAKYQSSKMLSLGSSNPLIIKFFMRLLKNCYKIEQSKFRCRIQCRFDQNIKLLEDYWRKTTGISSKQFYPTYIDKRTKGKPTKKKDYKGVCTIHYFNTRIQLELELLANEMMNRLIQ